MTAVDKNAVRKLSRSQKLERNNGQDTAATRSGAVPKRRRKQHDQQQRYAQASKLVSSSTWQAAIVLLVAIATSYVYNHMHNTSSDDPAVHRLMSSICHDRSKKYSSNNSEGKAYCSPAVKITQRTHTATRHITKGETILEIPRASLIWDLDAIRDSFIRRELLPAIATANNDNELKLHGIESTDSQHISSALLAVHLAILKSNCSASTSTLQTYVDFLPTYDHYAAFHPILWPDSELSQRLGIMTTAFEMVQSYKAMVLREYSTFCNASATFADVVSDKEYIAARLSVMTRSFGTGPLVETNEWDEEMHQLKTQYRLDFSKGCHAMVPILDMYQHHANPNVGFRYDYHKNAFVVSSVAAIHTGDELIDQYGRHSDSHLFAKYGFVNGDGSGHVQTNIALWHHIVTFETDVHDRREALSKQEVHMLKYLQYDDGYLQCVSENDGEAWELKRLKYKYLLRIANQPSRWTIVMPPRSPEARPGQNTLHSRTVDIPRWDPLLLRFDGSTVVSTCRVMSLTHYDYNDTAIDRLREAFDHNLAQLPSTLDALEYRTLACMVRLTSIAISRFPLTVEMLEHDVETLNKNSYMSKEWNTAHVQLGELQALHALKGVAVGGINRLTLQKDTIKSDDYRRYLRNQPCGYRLQQALYR